MQQLNGMQLSPEQLAQLNRQFAGNYGTVNSSGFDFAPAVEYGQGESGAGNNTIHGYSAIPQGTTWNLKDGEDFYGGFDKSGKFEGARTPHAFDMGDAAPFLMAIAAGAAALAPAAGAAGTAGAAGGTGAGAGGMVNGAFLGEGALSGIGAWDGAMAAAAGGGAAGGGVGAGMGGGGGGNGAFLGEAPWTPTGGGSLDFGAAGAGGGGAGAGVGGGGGNGAFLGENVASGVPSWDAAATKAGLSLGGGGGMGMKDILGIGTSLLGAASGAQGQESESSQTRDIPAWLKPYVQKNLGYASGLLDQQMAPGAMPGWGQMRNVGMGLLNTPQQGNGFNRFFPGK
jgi:hypothetical protein